MTKLGVSNSDFSNLNLGSVEIDTESFSFSPVDKTQSFEQNSEVSFEEMDVSSDLSSSSEKNEIVKKLSILLNECQIEISDLYSKRDTLNKQLQQTKDIYSKTEIGKKINDINKKIIDIKNKYEDKVKYLLLIESINEKIQEVENDNKELLNKQSNTLDIYSKTEIGKVINSNNEKIKEYQMIINIYSELENDTTNGTELLDLLKSKYNKYLESNDSYKAETYFYLYYAELEEQLKNSTGSKLEKLQNEYNENFNIENIYEQYVNCKIKIHDEEGSLEQLNEELKQIEFKASLLGYDIAEAYKQQKEYEAEQKRIESERIQAEYERQKKLDEENKNPFLFLWHMYEDSDLYKNSYKMGGRIWEHQMDIAQSKDINEFLQKTNEAYVDIKNTTLATVSQIPIKAWVGIEKAAEGIVDGCTIIGSGVISLGTFAVEYINGGMAKTDGFKFTEELIKNTQEFVGKDWIGNAEKWFYSTDLGKSIDETALIQHNSAEAQFISGIGEATFNIMTGGALAGATGLSAKTAMIATSGIKGMGIGYQNATIDGADAQSAALYGTASGSWEMLQWAVGAQINTYAANGFKTAGTNTAKVLGTLALSTSLDSIDAGVEGFVQPALQMIYKDSDYLTLFEQNGGFQNVIKQAAIGGVMSLATSIGDAEKSFKTAKEIDVQVDKKPLTERLRDKLDLSGLKQENFILDKKGNRIIPNYEKPQVNLQERIRNLAKATVGELELSGGMLGLFLAPELSPICLPAMLDGGIRFSDVITNNSIKDSLFIVNKNHKSNIWGYTDRISQTAKLKDALTLSLTNDKIGAFSIQGMNMFTQLQKSRNGIDITYSTHSQGQTAAFLKMLEKEGYIKDFVRADGGKQSLAFEKLLFGNTDNLFKKEQMYEMSFKLTDKKFDINAMNEIIAKRHIDTSNYTLKTITQNGEQLQIFVPNTSKIFKEATGAIKEKFLSYIKKENIKPDLMSTNSFLDKIAFVQKKSKEQINANSSNKSLVEHISKERQNQLIKAINDGIKLNGEVTMTFKTTKDITSYVIDNVIDLAKLKVRILGGLGDDFGNLKTKYQESRYLDRITYTGYEFRSIIKKMESLELRIDRNLPTIKKANQIYEMIGTEYPFASLSDEHRITASLRGMTSQNSMGRPGFVCAGYAQIYKELCDRLDIKCEYIRGIGIGDGRSERHAWNVVIDDDGSIVPVDCSWKACTNREWFGASDEFYNRHKADPDEKYRDYSPKQENKKPNVKISSKTIELDQNLINIENVIQTMDAKFGNGCGIDALQKFVNSHNYNIITRDNNARSLLQSIPFDEVVEYLKSNNKSIEIKDTMNYIMSALKERYGETIASSNFNGFLKTGNINLITSYKNARDFAQKLSPYDIKYYVNKIK